MSRKLLAPLFMLALVLAPFMSTSGGGAQPVGACEELASASAEAANACGRCGDRYCATQCGENAVNCPKDCAGVAE